MIKFKYFLSLEIYHIIEQITILRVPLCIGHFQFLIFFLKNEDSEIFSLLFLITTKTFCNYMH